jgi:lipopolysaccharide/colanic/teichoic acid biosynthesis glycosyltransferase/O-antigen/teichoic acid export membrane protein
MRSLRKALRGSLGGNLAALAGALAALTLATFVVARADGPAGVGDYALLRIMPWLLAVLASGGLAPASAYFLAGPSREDPHVRPTLVAMTVVAGAASLVIWVVASPLTEAVFFRDLTTALVAWAGLKTVTRLLVITAKAASQGTGDLAGSNWVIFLEELLFLPGYGVALGLGLGGGAAIVGALIASDLGAGALGWTRLARRGYFTGSATPSFGLARRIYAFGVRGQVGNLMSVVNLRLDFMIIALLAGPVTLGVYAIASKFAELLRLLPTAFYWVLYPSFAKQGATEAWKRAAWLLPRAAGATAIAAIPLAALAPPLLPLVYGHDFAASVLPGQVLLLGLSVEGAAGVVTAYLYGRGRPGLNSLATFGGVVVTVALDLLLIPRLSLLGAAVASTAAYLVTTSLLIACFVSLRPVSREPVVAVGDPIPPGVWRRMLDLASSAVLLVVLSPMLLAGWLLARWSTGASGIFRQVRVGEGGVPFTMLKFRSMRPATGGPEVTVEHDPRITRVGHILRATNIDELPQLINIFRGDMTLVGARPETVALALRYPAPLHEVFRHRPGLTGPGQLLTRWSDSLNGADDVETSYLVHQVPARVGMDLEYLRRPTLWRTLVLVGVTGVQVVRHVVPRRERLPEPDAVSAAELRSRSRAV